MCGGCCLILHTTGWGREHHVETFRMSFYPGFARDLDSACLCCVLAVRQNECLSWLKCSISYSHFPCQFYELPSMAYQFSSSTPSLTSCCRSPETSFEEFFQPSTPAPTLGPCSRLYPLGGPTLHSPPRPPPPHTTHSTDYDT